MTKSELIDALHAGDIGEVEFAELALELGMTLEQIGNEIAESRESF